MYANVESKAFRQLKPHERNYLIHDLELVVVVFALKIWRHHLCGVKFEVLSDYKCLKHFFDQKELNMRQRRWMEFFKDYEFELNYHPGKVIVVVDTLSRKSWSVAWMMVKEVDLVETFQNLNLGISVTSQSI